MPSFRGQVTAAIGEFSGCVVSFQSPRVRISENGEGNDSTSVEKLSRRIGRKQFIPGESNLKPHRSTQSRVLSS